MERPISEYRVLSLASSWVFLASFALFVFATTQTLNPLGSILSDYQCPLIILPTILPCFSLLRLVRLRLASKVHIPFFDGWFIHIVILTPYVIVALATYPMWKMG